MNQTHIIFSLWRLWAFLNETIENNICSDVKMLTSHILLGLYRTPSWVVSNGKSKQHMRKFKLVDLLEETLSSVKITVFVFFIL